MQQQDLFGEPPALVAVAAVKQSDPPSSKHAGALGAVPPVPPNWAEMSAREQWRENPWRACEEWLDVRTKEDDERGYAARSKVQHRAMWNTYLTYLKSIGVHPLIASGQHVAGFLDSLRAKHKAKDPQPPAPAKDSTKLRYLHLLIDVYNHLLRIGVRRAGNPCPAILRTFAPQPEKLPAALWLEHHQRFVDKVLSRPVSTWRETRDQAMLLLIVGSGLYANEILTLTLDMLQVDSSDPHILVPAHGRVPERAAPILPFVIEPLNRWLELRKTLKITDQIVFVSGKTNGKSGDAQMRPVTLYRKVREVLDDADGLEVKSRGGRGPQVLRNSFLMRQFEKNKPLEHVQRWGGHILPKSTLRFQRLVPYRDGVRAE